VSSPDKASTNSSDPKPSIEKPELIFDSEEPVSVNSLEEEAKHSEADFKGIWDRKQKRDNIKETSEQYAVIRPEVGAVNRKKGWGIGAFALTFVAFLVVQVIVSIIILASSGTTDPNEMLKVATAPLTTVVSAVTMYLTWVGGMFLVTRYRGQNSFKKDFWVSFKKWDVFIGLGVAVGLVLLVALTGWLFGDVLGLDLSASDNGAAITANEGIWLIVIGVGIASLLGPFMEELFFRGFLFQAVRKSIHSHLANTSNENESGLGLRIAVWMNKAQYWIAAIVSSIVFGMMHVSTEGVGSFGWWYLMGATGTLGLVFAFMATKLRRLGPGIFAHIFYNGLTLAMAVLLS